MNEFVSNPFSGSRIKSICVGVLATLMCVACVLWNLEVPTRIGVAILPQQYMAFQLGLALTLAFIQFDLNGNVKQKIGFIDGSIALIALITLLYAAWDFGWLLEEQAYRPWQITVIGAVVTVVVMEGIRRRTGWMLFTIVSAFLLYALVADKIPGRLIGKNLSVERLVQYVGFDPGAVFSTPLAVGTIIVLLFVFFGQLLFAAGGGAFFTDLAMAATGRSRGGSAKISVIGSALFGSISGSAVSNVVTTGVVTIPLMQRGGYNKNDAGAIEAVASTGGQLTPPIMGAAAFLMAEFLEISYLTVATAALLPALLYYVSVFTQIDLIAGRDAIKSADENMLSVRQVLASGWHFIIPFAVLLVALFVWRLDPEDSALFSSVAIIAVGFLRGYRGQKLTVEKLRSVFVDTGTSMVDLILVVASAGFVIGVLNITGLGFALTLVLVDSVGSNTVLLLLISALICIVLGMGMPTSGVYVLLAALVAPSLVQAGVQPVAAHLFILYFGMMSMITPPVALAAFAAATISKANPLATGLAAIRMGWAAFIIPFVFVASPALLMNGSVGEIISTALVTAVGILGVTAAIVGYWGAALSRATRALFLVLGMACLPSGLLSISKDLNYIATVSVAILAISLLRNARLRRRFADR